MLKIMSNYQIGIMGSLLLVHICICAVQKQIDSTDLAVRLNKYMYSRSNERDHLKSLHLASVHFKKALLYFMRLKQYNNANNDEKVKKI